MTIEMLQLTNKNFRERVVIVKQTSENLKSSIIRKRRKYDILEYAFKRIWQIEKALETFRATPIITDFKQYLINEHLKELEHHYKTIERYL